MLEIPRELREWNVHHTLEKFPGASNCSKGIADRRQRIKSLADIANSVYRTDGVRCRCHRCGCSRNCKCKIGVSFRTYTPGRIDRVDRISAGVQVLVQHLWIHGIFTGVEWSRTVCVPGHESAR